MGNSLRSDLISLLNETEDLEDAMQYIDDIANDHGIKKEEAIKELCQLDKERNP